MSHALVHRKTAFVLALMLAAVGFGSHAAHSAGGAGPTPNALRQVYQGTVVTGAGQITDTLANVELAEPPAGEPLTMQSVAAWPQTYEPTVGITRNGTVFSIAKPVDRVVNHNMVIRSDDGGVTWRPVQPELPHPLQHEPAASLDPYVYVDDTTDRVFNIELYGGCSYLLTSDDLGASWDRNPAACGGIVNDHQTLITGVPPKKMTVPMSGDYPNVVYYCFNRVVDANCGRSLDGGSTFTPAGTPAFLGFDPNAGGLCGGLHGHIATDKDGFLYLPKGHCGTPWTAVSEDGGETWRRSRVSTISSAETHTSVAADAAGNLYYVWFDEAKKLPFLAVSKDRGVTWGPAIMIAPPGVKEVNFPVIEAGDAGHIAIGFPGSVGRNRTDALRPWNQYVVISTNAADASPIFESTTLNDPADPVHRGTCLGRCAGMGDFIDIEISPAGDVYAVGGDNCVNTCAKGQNATSVDRAVLIVGRQLSGPVMRTTGAAAP